MLALQVTHLPALLSVESRSLLGSASGGSLAGCCDSLLVVVGCVALKWWFLSIVGRRMMVVGGGGMDLGGFLVGNQSSSGLGC